MRHHKAPHQNVPCTPDHTCLTQENGFLNPDGNFHAVLGSYWIYATWVVWL